PGQRGSIVVAAHVDLNGQRGVFFDLVDSRRGDTVVITLGTTRHRYRVVSRTQVAKTDVANAGIFNTERPETLVLVTCGGQFDRAVHSYRDNVVVTAVPA
ncbi:MAG: class F sortase, partial [Actinomycetota bacterium]